MDCLERKMNSLHSELSEFKSRCSSLEEQNASLVAQIKRLQAQLHSVAKTGALSAAASSATPLHAVRRIEVGRKREGCATHRGPFAQERSAVFP